MDNVSRDRIELSITVFLDRNPFTDELKLLVFRHSGKHGQLNGQLAFSN